MFATKPKMSSFTLRTEKPWSGYTKRKMIAIDKALNYKDLQNLKIICIDYLSWTVIKKAHRGLHIFSELELVLSNELVISNFMTECLYHLELYDLLLTEFGFTKEDMQKQIAFCGYISPYRAFLLDVAKDLTDAEFKEVKFSLTDTIPNDLRKDINTFVDLYLVLEKLNRLSHSNVNLLLEVCKIIKRYDLVRNVVEYMGKSTNYQLDAQQRQMAVSTIQSQMCHQITGRNQISVRNVQTQTSHEEKNVTHQHPSRSSTNEQANMHIPHYRLFLLRISEDLDKGDFEKVKFLLVDILPTSVREEVKNFLDLCMALEKRKRLLHSDVSILLEICNKIKRHDLEEKVIQYMAQNKQKHNYHRISKQQPEHQQEHIKNYCGANTPPQNQLELQESLPEYKMNSRPRGYCVIINNMKFHQDGSEFEILEERLGSEIDVQCLQECFSNLHFLVAPNTNLTSGQMVALMEDYAGRSHESYDCFVCCVLSHGSNGVLYGCDGCEIKTDDLTNGFISRRSKTLAGKPKLFIIQACMGSERQLGADFHTDSEPLDNSPFIYQGLFPIEEDFLLAYATVPGFESYRSQTHGSWYISTLTKVLNHFAGKYDLLSMLVKVNEEVSNLSASDENGIFKQVPSQCVTLRKQVFFQ